MSAAAQARACLRRRHHGVLATLSQKLGGYPFGSVAPFVLDHGARPVILITISRRRKMPSSLRLDFEQPVTDGAGTRAALIAMAKKARGL